MIKSAAEFLATQKSIDSLIDRGELTPDEEDYLDVLGTLVYKDEKACSTLTALERKMGS